MIAATGPKRLIVIGRHAWFHVGKNRRRIIGTPVGRDFAAEQQLRPLLN
jgi:hypothetical protein